MRAVVQRVSQANCKVDDCITGEIEDGLLVFLGVEDGDTSADLEWLANKIASLRIFSDEAGKMNLSVCDVGGNILLISQFTLFAQTKKGNRPSFVRAGQPAYAELLYDQMANTLSVLIDRTVQQGIFGADMKIEAHNDGPVTIIMNTKDKDNF